jgi:hypothetical protein
MAAAFEEMSQIKTFVNNIKSINLSKSLIFVFISGC